MSEKERRYIVIHLISSTPLPLPELARLIWNLAMLTFLLRALLTGNVFLLESSSQTWLRCTLHIILLRCDTC